MPRLRDYPLLAHYGAMPSEKLSPAEAARAGFEGRVASIARLLVAESLRLHRRLSPEGRCAFDPEDIFLAIWVELRKRDALYDAGRGGYGTFAATIIRHAWADLAPRARAVRPPAPRPGRRAAADPERDRRAGRAGRDPEPLPEGGGPDAAPGPLEALIIGEDMADSARRVAVALEGLSPGGCVALKALGLWGGPPSSLAAAARQSGLPARAVRQGLREARLRLPRPAARADARPPDLVPLEGP